MPKYPDKSRLLWHLVMYEHLQECSIWSSRAPPLAPIIWTISNTCEPADRLLLAACMNRRLWSKSNPSLCRSSGTHMWKELKEFYLAACKFQDDVLAVMPLAWQRKCMGWWCLQDQEGEQLSFWLVVFKQYYIKLSRANKPFPNC